MDGGPPVRAERVALGEDVTQLPALIAAIRAHAGLEAVPVTRPLVGVALLLPSDADPLRTAHALDAEQVTAGYLDHAGRACVALPADEAHIEQLAHSVAKVVHLLWEVHTAFINEQSDACPLVEQDAPDAETAASAVLIAISALLTALGDWQRVIAPPSELRGMVAEGLAVLREAGDGNEDAEA